MTHLIREPTRNCRTRVVSIYYYGTYLTQAPGRRLLRCWRLCGSKPGNVVTNALSSGSCIKELLSRQRNRTCSSESSRIKCSTGETCAPHHVETSTKSKATPKQNIVSVLRLLTAPFTAQRIPEKLFGSLMSESFHDM